MQQFGISYMTFNLHMLCTEFWNYSRVSWLLIWKAETCSWDFL